jgi:uncharacterized membrane protein YgaE (UPF0421/DUF939 family)
MSAKHRRAGLQRRISRLESKIAVYQSELEMLRRKELQMAVNEAIAKMQPATRDILLNFTGLHITDENPNAEVCKCGKPSVFNEVTQLFVGCCQDCIPF